MRLWLKIVVPMGIAAALVTVLAIGFGSPSSDAAQCNEGINSSGRLSAGSSTTFTSTFCSDPASNFVAWASIGRASADKDIALLVTDPTGQQFFVDEHMVSTEVFIAYAPLAEGTWQVQVINHGSRNVKYELSMGFG